MIKFRTKLSGILGIGLRNNEFVCFLKSDVNLGIGIISASRGINTGSNGQKHQSGTCDNEIHFTAGLLAGSLRGLSFLSISNRIKSLGHRLHYLSDFSGIGTATIDIIEPLEFLI